MPSLFDAFGQEFKSAAGGLVKIWLGNLLKSSFIGNLTTVSGLSLLLPIVNLNAETKMYLCLSCHIIMSPI